MNGGYGMVSQEHLTTLEQMLIANNDTHVDVLSIDCEGCEWAALSQIAVETPWVLRGTRLLQLELHVTPSMLTPRERTP